MLMLHVHTCTLCVTISLTRLSCTPGYSLLSYHNNEKSMYSLGANKTTPAQVFGTTFYNKNKNNEMYLCVYNIIIDICDNYV